MGKADRQICERQVASSALCLSRIAKFGVFVILVLPAWFSLTWKTESWRGFDYVRAWLLWLAFVICSIEIL
jgi:hypothetical protein